MHRKNDILSKKKKRGIQEKHGRTKKKRFIESKPKGMEGPMEWLYDTFQVPIPLRMIEPRRTSERKCMEFLDVEVKQKY